MPEAPGVSNEDRANVMSDLNMLRGPGGRERTEKQYHRLLIGKRIPPDIASSRGTLQYDRISRPLTRYFPGLNLSIRRITIGCDVLGTRPIIDFELPVN